MEMRLETPSRLYLPDDSSAVSSFLTFDDRGPGYLIAKMKMNRSWRSRDPEGFNAKMEELKGQVKRSILFHDEDGRPYTYAGLASELYQRFKWDLVPYQSKPVQYSAMPW